MVELVKMKILKRIKRIACSPKLRHQNSSSSGTNNLPPISFHTGVSGDNIRISPDGFTARRVDSFCKGIAFSGRPVKVNERVYLKFAELSTNWSGAVRFGFTSNDPATYRGNLPKYACPDLTNRTGNWAKALNERYAQCDSVLFYYVTEDGSVHFGLNGEDKGVFFTGVNTSVPLWSLIDVYGNTVAVELIDPRHHANRHSRQFDNIATQMSQVSLTREPLPQVYRDAEFDSLSFHTTKGRNIRLSNDRSLAGRNDSHYSHGYVFTERQLQLGEKLVLQILQTDEMYTGSLAFGLTTCDPSKCDGYDLPEDPHKLLDRKEYWVVVKDVANLPNAGDELGFKINNDGQVLMYKNNQPPVTLMHVDSTQRFYAFFDLYGSTLKVKLLGSLRDRSTRTVVRDMNGNRNATVRTLGKNEPLTVRLPSGNNYTANNNYNKTVTNEFCQLHPLMDDNNECSVCCEKTINSVLYSCGHMCMCYECAYRHWKRPDGGHCPICRALIRDVIKTYWS